MNSELGPVYLMTLEPFDDGTLIVSDPKVAEGILSSQKLLTKGFDYDLIKPWLGNGLLISTGTKWHQRRKILTPAFHFQILEKFVEIMEDQGKILVNKLTEWNGKEIDVYPLVNLYTLDVICGTKNFTKKISLRIGVTCFQNLQWAVESMHKIKIQTMLKL
jgi:cytochrome P450